MDIMKIVFAFHQNLSVRQISKDSWNSRMCHWVWWVPHTKELIYKLPMHSITQNSCIILIRSLICRDTSRGRHVLAISGIGTFPHNEDSNHPLSTLNFEIRYCPNSMRHLVSDVHTFMVINTLPSSWRTLPGMRTAILVQIWGIFKDGHIESIV